MRHKNKNKKLSKATDQRMALLCSLAEGLLEKEKITTSLVRAKETSRLVERLLSWAKAGDFNSRRKVARFIKRREILQKVFQLAATKAEGRPGGYTRISRVGFRRGDAAPLVCLEIL
jgi:large subunit ribosomal protein L17